MIALDAPSRAPVAPSSAGVHRDSRLFRVGRARPRTEDEVASNPALAFLTSTPSQLLQKIRDATPSAFAVSSDSTVASSSLSSSSSSPSSASLVALMFEDPVTTRRESFNFIAVATDPALDIDALAPSKDVEMADRDGDGDEKAQRGGVGSSSSVKSPLEKRHIDFTNTIFADTTVKELPVDESVRSDCLESAERGLNAQNGRGLPKGGKIWKKTIEASNRAATLSKIKSAHSSFELRQQQKQRQMLIRAKQQALKDTALAERKERARRMKQKQETKEANRKKNQVVQVIKDTKKIKKMSKKQRKSIIKM
jgi:rRNA-processing protein CGR1